MQADNPLWYDYAEPDEAPGRSLLVLAGLFGLVVSGVKAAVRAYWLPDRIWCRAADAFGKYRAPRS